MHAQSNILGKFYVKGCLLFSGKLRFANLMLAVEISVKFTENIFILLESIDDILHYALA